MSLHRATRPGCVEVFELHARAPADYPYLLQSVAGHPQSGRYDLLFGGVGEVLLAEPGEDFLDRLSRYIKKDKPPIGDEALFGGGWFLYLGYELAMGLEPRLHLPPSPHRLPAGFAARCEAVVIVDREKGETRLVATSAAALARLEKEVDALTGTAAVPELPSVVKGVREDAPEQFLQGVERIREYLRAGDAFQVNLSRAWSAELAPGADHRHLYTRLRRSNPAPFAGLACHQGSAILSSSPERLISIDDRLVQTRPIAGTRPRGENEAEDQALRERLLESLKERAEHIMLIDLERNDLGRVCVPGSVEVSELMAVESYRHVHHIVSNVRGRLREGVAPLDAVRAVFPGGTITGCPKLRAMEIIGELEGVGRGFYTGAMGYLSDHGRLDLNILIRSLLVEDGQVHLRAGAGIVADSVPELELAETRAKARGLLAALQ